MNSFEFDVAEAAFRKKNLTGKLLESHLRQLNHHIKAIPDERSLDEHHARAYLLRQERLKE